MTTRWLGIDLGAESGRGILAAYDGRKLALTEIGRFPTSRGEQDLGADGVRRWDIDRITGEVQALVRAGKRDASGGLAGVGVDTWGVDFGLVDQAGNLLEPPVQYRDDSHARAMEAVHAVIPRPEIWTATGIQFLPFNTLYQLFARHLRDPRILERAHRLLMIPDLLHHRISRSTSLDVEATNASTTQMLDPATRAWRTDLLDRLGLPHGYLGPIVEAGTRLGDAGDVPVFAPATHDTASAVVAAPAENDTRWAFLSSGTWSLLGVERSAPLLTDEAMVLGFSNEGGVAGTTRFLKNIMGLWMVQECRRSLARAGFEYDYAALTEMAAAAPEGGPVVDATDQRFLAPRDMPEEIRLACRDSGQAPPNSTGALIRCCLESLALAYRRTLRALERLQGERFEVLHIVGGGCRNRVLNQWTADACGLPVVAGPAEATSVGNVLSQMVGAGALSSWQEARNVCRLSFDVETFCPDPAASARWDDRVA